MVKRNGPEDGDPIRFAYGEVRRHIKANHPNCPAFSAHQIALRVARRTWPGASMGNAVGISIQTYLRHEKTNYDKLLAAGMARDDARKQIRDRVKQRLAKWGRQAASDE